MADGAAPISLALWVEADLFFVMDKAYITCTRYLEVTTPSVPAHSSIPRKVYDLAY